jgi:hypothetical protein
MDVFTAPWPGPGNSEGPVDPDGWTVVEHLTAEESEDEAPLEPPFVATSPWPGPGDSDGSVGI